MNRYWVSWWSGYYKSEGCTQPPFQIWNSGERPSGIHRPNRTEISFCAVVDSDSENSVWELVKKHFPDYKKRFCNQKEPDFEPGDRFPK